MDKEVERRGDMLGQSLSGTKVMQDLAYKEAELGEDTELQELLEEIGRLEEEVKLKQQEGNFSLQDLQRLKEIQADVQSRELFQQYTAAYQKAAAFLAAVNQEISAALGFDFSLFASSRTEE
jgi:cell fate (sporulation/competence/biofilm development) regulator YlbF (YheA/YmcA/DUF963 family)